ncbi:MAG TPA: TetR/AcrR family transcriptional regulator [Rhizobiaceae bacterium]|nr:TetR/AcrR family transcriptional regulator [Rhizobiaceae bacterium]
MERISTTKERPARKRRTQQDRSAETQAQLIAGTMQALVDVGYASATTSVIAGRSGVTTGALQHHYGSKDILILAVLDHHYGIVREQLESVAVERPKSIAEVGKTLGQLMSKLGEVYGSEDYLAIWEILLGTRGDRNLHTSVIAHRKGSVAMSEKLWLDTFRDVGIGKQKLKDLFHLTMSVLRGIVFYRAVEPDPNVIQRQIKLLASCVEMEMKHS